jgi:hypothetical protein
MVRKPASLACNRKNLTEDDHDDYETDEDVGSFSAWRSDDFERMP